MLYGEPNGYWWLDTRLDPDRGVHRFVSAPLPKPLTRHVSLTWIYLGTDEQTEVQVKLDTSDYPISVVAESVIRILMTRTQRQSQDTEHIPVPMGGTDHRHQLGTLGLMRRVLQTRTGAPNGNCTAAC